MCDRWKWSQRSVVSVLAAFARNISIWRHSAHPFYFWYRTECCLQYFLRKSSNNNESTAGKEKGVMVHSVSGWTRDVQVKLWDPLRTCAIPERLRGVSRTRRYTNPRPVNRKSMPYQQHHHAMTSVKDYKVYRYVNFVVPMPLWDRLY